MTDDRNEPPAERPFRVLTRITTMGYVDVTAPGRRSALERANTALTGASQPELMLTERLGASRVETDRSQVYDLTESQPTELEEDTDAE